MKTSTIPEVDITQFVPTGRHNAVSRKYLVSISGMNDRMIRKQINESEIPIINTGYGYFIPDLNDEGDVRELNTYLHAESNRAITLLAKIDRIQNYMEME